SYRGVNSPLGSRIFDGLACSELMPADYLRSNAKKSAGERKTSPVSFDFFPRCVFLDFEAKEQILGG
ncbi:MAG: hypothetical protein ACKOLA_02105, partial [Spartobacteria bacterium]